MPLLKRSGKPSLHYVIDDCTEQVAALQKGIPQLGLVRLPTRFHSLLTLLPATCAQHVLHFCAQHDGLACREP